jgi:hypothetical protein
MKVTRLEERSFAFERCIDVCAVSHQCIPLFHREVNALACGQDLIVLPVHLAKRNEKLAVDFHNARLAEVAELYQRKKQVEYELTMHV